MANSSSRPARHRCAAASTAAHKEATSRTSSVAGITNQTLVFNSNDQPTNDVFDANGNTRTNSGNTFAYDVENRMTNAVASGTNIVIVYDGDGNRVRKIVGTTTNLYLVDDRNPTGYAQVLEEKTISGGSTNLVRLYTYGLDLISQKDTTTAFYGYDGNGNTRYLTATNATVTDTYVYDAFGVVITNTGTTTSYYRYSGEQYDPNLGFIYLRARYMNPNSGRFLTRDSLLGKTFDPPSLHRYLYCANNPVNRIDPSGHEFTFTGLLTAIAINATLSAIITFPIDYAFHRSVNHALKSAGFSAIIGGALGAFFYAGGAVLAASDVAVIDAAAATGTVEVTEGGLIIGVIKNGQVVSYSLPNTSHAFMASQAGVLTSDGSLIAGAEVFSISKEGGKLLITGSFNFNRFVSATGDATLKAFFK